jgi:hypothetical protein
VLASFLRQIVPAVVSVDDRELGRRDGHTSWRWPRNPDSLGLDESNGIE